MRPTDGSGAGEATGRWARFTPTERRAWGALTLIGGLAAIVAVALFFSNPDHNTRAYELFTACMDIVAVGVIGAFITVAVSTLQRDKDARTQRADRDVTEHLENRNRLDEQIRKCLIDTLTAYSTTKSIRRLLEAHITGRTRRDAVITLEVLDEYMPDLIAQQLIVERLERMVPILEERGMQAGMAADAGDASAAAAGGSTDDADMGAVPATLVKRYELIARYLNEVVEEYQYSRQDVVNAGESVKVAELRSKAGPGRMYAFVFETGNFVANAGVHLNAIVTCLERALLTPVALPRGTRGAPDDPAPGEPARP